MYNPEFLELGSCIIINDNEYKLCGEIKQLYEHKLILDEDNSSQSAGETPERKQSTLTAEDESPEIVM